MTVITKLDQSASWDLITNTSGFPGLINPPTTLQGQTVSAAPSLGLTYYIRFTPDQSTGPLDGATLYQLNSFSFDAQQIFNIGSQSGGAGTGKVTLDPLNFALSQPSLTPALLQMLASGAHFKQVDVLGYRQDGTLATDDSFGLAAASNLSTNGGETAVALQYGEVSITSNPATGASGSPVTTSWNALTNSSEVTDLGSAPTTLQGQTVSPASPGGLTYYVRFTPTQTAGPLDGTTLYELNNFSFDDQNTVSIGTASGAGAGKAKFDPLDLAFTQPQLTPALLRMLGAGAHFQQVDVLGYRQDGTLATDDSFGFAVASSLSTDNSGETAVALQYGEVSITSNPAAGTTGSPVTASWSAITNSSEVTDLSSVPTTLQGQTTSPAGSPDLTYYIRFTPDQNTGPLDGSTLYQLNSFSFDAQQISSIGSQSGGAGAGKATLDPLNFVLSQPSLTPALFQMLASGAHFKQVDVLGYRQDGTLATDDSFGVAAASTLSTNNGGETAVALQYGEVSITSDPAAGTTGSPAMASWNALTNSSEVTDLSSVPTTLQGQTTSSTSSTDLTYYIRFTPAQITGPLDGSTLYQLDSFSFDDKNTVSLSGTSGAGAGKATLDPLSIVLSQQSLTPALFQQVASGALFKQVDVLGYRQDGTLATDDSFGLAAATSLSTDSSGETAVELQYGEVSITSDPATGTTGSPVTASWSAITNSSEVTGLSSVPATLQGQTTSSAASPGLTYYIRFTPTQTTGPLDGSTLYQLNSFSFGLQNTASIGSASSGAGAGKAVAKPLDLVLSQPSLTPALFQMLAAGAHFTSVDVLAVNPDGTVATDDRFGLVSPTDLSTDSSSQTSVALDYGTLQIRYAAQGTPVTGSWNFITNIAGETQVSVAPPPTISPAVTSDLTYYVRFTENPVVQGESTDGPLDGSTLYQLNSFSFDIHNTSTIGSASGAGAGKAVFNPLNLVLNQSSLTPALLQTLATGAHFQQVDVLGYRQDGTLATDDSFGFAVDTSLSTNNQGDTAVGLEYGRLSIQTYSNLDIGTFTAVTPATVEQGQTTIIGTVTLGFDGEALALTQTAGSGTLSLGQISDGVQQIIYTAPTSIAASAIDAVSYTVSDQSGDTVATPTASVQLDAGPSITSVPPSVVEKSQTTEIGIVTPGLAGDTLSLQQTGGNGTLALQSVGGVEEVIYTAPPAIATSTADTVSYTISDQHNDAMATGSASVQLDAGPSITSVTPSVVEKNQSTEIGTVTPGLAGDLLTLQQTGGSGTLALQLVGGVEEVIYTAPPTIATSTPDTVSYTISDQHNDAMATGSASVQLDAGPSITAVTPSVVENGQTTEIGIVTPGLAGDLLTLQQTSGTGTLALQLVSGVEEVIYTAPSTIASILDTVSYTISDQHMDAVATGSNTVPFAPAGDTIYVGTAGGSISVRNGNSAIDGRAGNETITAGNGADVIFGGPNDAITAGNGGDTIYSGANSSITARNGNDAVTAGANSSVQLGNGNNTVTAGPNSSTKLGNGNDTVTAGDNSSVKLGNGNDTVTVGANSTIAVGNGNDHIFAGANDLINIGRGSDTVAFGESPNPIAIGNETINGFNPAQDILQFNPALLSNCSAADITQVGANTVIQIDPANSVTLDNVKAAALSASNFHFS